MPDIRFENPPELGPSFSPYSHLARVKSGELLCIAGQVATDAQGGFVGVDDFDAQCEQVFRNIRTALLAAGGDWGNLVQFTSYLTDPADIPRFHAWRVRTFPEMFPEGAYPTNTLLIISRLVRPEFRVEVQALAAL